MISNKCALDRLEAPCVCARQANALSSLADSLCEEYSADSLCKEYKHQTPHLLISFPLTFEPCSGHDLRLKAYDLYSTPAEIQ